MSPYGNRDADPQTLFSEVTYRPVHGIIISVRQVTSLSSSDMLMQSDSSNGICRKLSPEGGVGSSPTRYVAEEHVVSRYSSSLGAESAISASQHWNIIGMCRGKISNANLLRNIRVKQGSDKSD